MPALNDDGSVGAIPYSILTIFVFALAYIALGAVIDELVIADNDLIDSGVPYSEQRASAFGAALLGFHVMPFVTVLTVMVFLIQNGLQRQDTTIKPVLVPLLVSLIGITACLLFVLGIGPVVDSFVALAGSLDFTEWGREMVKEPMVFADWTYILIKIMVVGFTLYPFIYLFKRHEYQDIDPYMR